MKGIKLITRICIVVAFVIGVFMALLNLYPSWSQYAGNAEDPFLYATLFLICLSFYGASVVHSKRYKILFWIKSTDIRFEHLARVVAFLFGGVLIFSVNSPVKFIEILHLIFTGSAIGIGYVLLWFYTKKVWSFIGVCFGVIGFVLGFVFNLYSTAWAEVLAALPLGIFMYMTIND